MKQQNKQYELDLFNSLGEEGFDVLDEGYYSFLFKSIKDYGLEMNGQVLEAGCGSGFLGRRLLKYFNNIEVLGVDISGEIVKNSNSYKIDGYQAICGDLEVPDLFSDNYFNAILCSMILHHFPDISKVLDNFKRWLKPDGVLILLEPNGSNPVSKLSKFLRKLVEILISKEHIIYKKWGTPNETSHSISGYRKKLNQNSFNVKKLDGVFIYSEVKFSSIIAIKDILYLVYRNLFPTSLYSSRAIVIFAENKKNNNASIIPFTPDSN